jgi:uncharacterized protein YjdB
MLEGGAMMPSPQATALSVWLCAVFSLACDDGRPDLTGPSRVASLVVQPFTASLEVGETLRLTPVIRDSNGIILTDYPVTWTTSDPEVAGLTSAGRVTALRSGSATITAVADGERASVNIVVLIPVAVVEITPDAPVIAVGTSVQLMATVLGPGGTRVTGRVVSWSTSDPGIASVSVGKVGGRRPGFAEIEATAGDAKSTTVVTVLPAGESPPSEGAR